jgi:hypothetical protein
MVERLLKEIKRRLKVIEFLGIRRESKKAALLDNFVN